MSFSCNHTGWFRLSGKDQIYLHYADRTDNVIREMAYPDRQYPSMLFFIGGRAKDTAIRQLFPNNNMPRGRTDSIVDLRSDSATITSDFPILFADSNPSTDKASRIGDFPCHQNRTFLINWKAPISQNTTRALFARLVSLFSDVICIFADDFGSLRDVGNLLIAWIRLGSPSALPQPVRPRVVIVASQESSAVTHDVLEEEELRCMLQNEDPAARQAVFSSISIMQLTGDHISPLARHRRLKEVLFSELDASRKDRIEHRLLFSAVHFSAFVKQAMQHVANSLTTPFDFIESTRLGNPIKQDYRQHLSTFFNLARRCHMSYEILATFVASSILLDAYPPRMHKFAPLDVFQRLYKDHCLMALNAAFESGDLAHYICKTIEDQMDLLFIAVDVGFETPVQLHASNIQPHSAVWTHLQSHGTCLFCLRRKPEHRLTCGHTICDMCLVRFGSRIVGKECHYEISQCILCVRRGTAIAKIKPDTADVRILSIDGGGIGGVVPLEYLGLLQRALKPSLRIQDLFEEAFGTRGLIVIGLFLKCWDVATCIRTFDLLVRDFFGLHLTKGRGLITLLRNYFRCWLSDGCYDVNALERSLKDVFGEDRRMFDAPESGVSGCKVAVTATTISDAYPYVFSNYNGNGIRDRACGYKHFRPETIDQEPFLWQAGRATSAAPVLFKSAHIKSLGSFQDGALRHNNPMDLAVWESQRIWSSSTAADVVLSLGTGTKTDLQSPKAPHFRHVMNDGFIPRLYRSFISSLDGEHAWRDSVNRLDEIRKANYFRLNIQYPGEEPRLDDVGQIESLRRSVHLRPTDTKDLTNILCALLAASFYFELGSLPVYRSGHYLCWGLLRCRNNSQGVLESLNQLQTTQLDLITPTECLGPLAEHDICSSCREYCKIVEFHVRSLDDVLDICVRFNDKPRKISGVPHSIRWFIDQQHLDSPFGTSFHEAKGTSCGACGNLDTTQLPSRGREKRKAAQLIVSPQPGRKRPRLQINLRR